MRIQGVLGGGGDILAAPGGAGPRRQVFARVDAKTGQRQGVEPRAGAS